MIRTKMLIPVLRLASRHRIHSLLFSSYLSSVAKGQPAKYGLSIKEWRHIRLIRDLELTEDDHEDSFYPSDCFTKHNSDKPYTEKDLHGALVTFATLKRFKSAISLIEWMIQQERVPAKRMNVIVQIISDAFVAKVISTAQAKDLVAQLQPLITSLPEPFRSQSLATCAPFLEDLDSTHANTIASFKTEKSRVFATNIAAAIRKRNFPKFGELCDAYPDLKVMDEKVVYNDWLKWVKADRALSKELITKAFSPIFNNYRCHEEFFNSFIKPLNAIPHAPTFYEVEVDDDLNCGRCRQKFALKPVMSDSDYKSLFSIFANYAKSGLHQQWHISSSSQFAEKLCKLRTNDPQNRPICLVDAPNVCYGTNHLSAISLLSKFITTLYPYFSGFGLVTKFNFPTEYLQRFNQMRVKILHAKSGVNDDISLLLAYASCGKDTHVVTNDFFGDHLNGAAELKNVKNFEIAYNSHVLRFNKAGIIELPTRLSSYAQRTSSGIHIPVRKTLLDPNSYKYYCCDF